MPVLVTSVSLVLLLAAATALPTRESFVWMPDGEGNLHLVDLLQTEPNPKVFDGDTDVTLYLYTQKNPSTPQIIKGSDISSSSLFDPKVPTRLITHGWISSARTLDQFVKAYFSTGKNFNVILVDWSGPASELYSSAVTSSRLVGEYLATVILDLVSNRGLNLDDVFLIGHNLGGHLFGVTGDRLDGKVAHVVGLDPAGPLFGSVSLQNRLDPTDGKLVQVVHTNSGLLGYSSTCGDVDFLPNGGMSQAGCGLDLSGSCSHARAPMYYVESINTNKFAAVLCDCRNSANPEDCPRDYLGEYCSGRVPGVFCLNTNTASPFALG